MTENTVAKYARAYRELRGNWGTHAGTHAEALCAEVDRLSEINSGLCRDFNSMLVKNSKLQEERDALQEELTAVKAESLLRWQAARTAQEDLKQMEAGLTLIRMSNGWRYLCETTQNFIKTVLKESS